MLFRPPSFAGDSSHCHPQRSLTWAWHFADRFHQARSLALVATAKYDMASQGIDNFIHRKPRKLLLDNCPIGKHERPSHDDP
jgi:hypothetical protein